MRCDCYILFETGNKATPLATAHHGYLFVLGFMNRIYHPNIDEV